MTGPTKFSYSHHYRNDNEKLLSKVLTEIDYLQSLEKNARELIDLVNRGYQIKRLIPTEDYSYKTCRNLFSELQKIAFKLKDTLDQYGLNYKNNALYRGILIYDVTFNSRWSI